MEIATQKEGQTLWSEFFGLKGDLLLAASVDKVAEAESWYQRALETATQVHAPMLELRAAMRLGRLWRGQGRTEEARALLTKAYEQLTEGFSTADLKEAKTLLDDLADTN
jgi:adenylate cyclase